MNYQEKSEYWVKKDEAGKHLPKEELLQKIDAFIKAHNTFALATGCGDYVRCSPVEYNYIDSDFYVFSEGGKKFIGLEKNKNVAFAIYESYKGFGNIHSLQGMGKAELIEPFSEEYNRICAYKKVSVDALKKMGIEMPLLKIKVTSYDYLDSDLKKENFDNRQHIDF